MAPPRLRIMLEMPEAAAASCGATLPSEIALSGASIRAWPTARTMLGTKSWSPA